MRDEATFEIEAYQTTTGHTLTDVKLNYVNYDTEDRQRRHSA
jgi:hypothetical protein